MANCWLRKWSFSLTCSLLMGSGVKCKNVRIFFGDKPLYHVTQPWLLKGWSRLLPSLAYSGPTNTLYLATLRNDEVGTVNPGLSYKASHSHLETVIVLWPTVGYLQIFIFLTKKSLPAKKNKTLTVAFLPLVWSCLSFRPLGERI